MKNKKKHSLHGKPYRGAVSSTDTLTLQLCVKNRGVGWLEAKAELIRRGKPILPPTLTGIGNKVIPPFSEKKQYSKPEVEEEKARIAKSENEDDSNELSHLPRAMAKTGVTTLIEALERIMKNGGGANVKRVIATASRLLEYINDECDEIPTAKQKKSIQGRLDRINNSIIDLFMLSGTPSNLASNLNPVYDYIGLGIKEPSTPTDRKKDTAHDNPIEKLVEKLNNQTPKPSTPRESIKALMDMMNQILNNDEDKVIKAATGLASVMRSLIRSMERFEEYLSKCGDVPTEAQINKIRERSNYLEEQFVQIQLTNGCINYDQLDYKNLMSFLEPLKAIQSKETIGNFRETLWDLAYLWMHFSVHESSLTKHAILKNTPAQKAGCSFLYIEETFTKIVVWIIIF